MQWLYGRQYPSYRRVRVLWVLAAAADSLEVGSLGWEGPASRLSNSMGTRGAKEDWIEELRLSRSRASRTRVPEPEPEPAAVEDWRGELPLIMWDGIADGFWDGGEPEPMLSEV
jgi:hypothetical protein